MSVSYVKSDGTLVNQLSVGADNILDVNIVGGSIPAPVGMSTYAAQTDGSQVTQIVQGGHTAIVSAGGALKVDGSAVTQPVSGTVTANIGTAGTLALDATLTGGTQVTAIKAGGNTATVTAASALKVDGSAVTQPISAASLPLPTNASTDLSVAQPTTSTAITPSDATDLTATVTKGLWVGTAGNLSVKLKSDGTAVTLSNVPSGTYVPGSFARVMAATTATNIVGFGG